MNIFFGPPKYYPNQRCSRSNSCNKEWYGGYHYFGSIEYYEHPRDDKNPNPFNGHPDTIEIVKSSLFKKKERYEFKRRERNPDTLSTTVVTKVFEFVCYQMVETNTCRYCYALFRNPQKPEKGDFEKIRLEMELVDCANYFYYEDYPQEIMRWEVDYGDFFDIKPINSTI